MIHYCQHCGKELEDFQFLCSSCHRNVYLESLGDEVTNKASSALSATQIEANTQWAKYKCGKNGATGHGFAAEDANALNDILHFKDVDFAGRDNEKDGPDRIVDGTPIQTKYCATAKASLEAAFDAETGLYRYKWRGGSGNCQVLEVPKDQYEQVVEGMRNKILEGKVEGVSDPSQATRLVKCGDYTYQQAKNIAKAGNIDSIIFDAKTNSVVALGAFGVSFAIRLSLMSLACRNSKDLSDAVKLSFLSGLQNGTITLVSSVATMQLLKTSFGRSFAAAMQLASKSTINQVYTYNIGKDIIHSVAKDVLSKSIYGGAAKNCAIKFLRTNAISNVVLFVVTSIPDVYRCFVENSISTPQFMKNLVVSSTGMAGMTIGYFLGARLGSGALGALAGGALASLIAQPIINKIHKDDNEQMQELVKIALLQLSSEYLLQSQEEFDATIASIRNEKAIDTTLLRAMYTIGREGNNDTLRVDFAKECLGYYFGCTVRNRRKLQLKGNSDFLLSCIEELTFDEKKYFQDKKSTY